MISWKWKKSDAPFVVLGGIKNWSYYTCYCIGKWRHSVHSDYIGTALLASSAPRKSWNQASIKFFTCWNCSFVTDDGQSTLPDLVKEVVSFWLCSDVYDPMWNEPLALANTADWKSVHYFISYPSLFCGTRELFWWDLASVGTFIWTTQYDSGLNNCYTVICLKD